MCSLSSKVVFGVVVVCVFGLPAFGQPWDGNGVEGDPYLIYDACDMQTIGADANYWDAHFVLCADIDLGIYTGTSFNIIGTEANPFTGVFDGNGHMISNFTQDSIRIRYTGLFGYIYGEGAEIRDLGLIDPNCASNSRFGYCGSLVGYLQDGAISGCYVEGGSVTGGYTVTVGGLVGNSSGTISNCYSSASVSGGWHYVGGLAGYNVGEIYNCYSEGDITGGGDSVGGLVGQNGSYNSIGSISNSYSTGSVTGRECVGGLVGHNERDCNICDSYSIGDVTGDSYVGGLVGESEYGSIISKCYSMGDVTGSIRSIGGLVGWSGSSISNCYSLSTVDGNDNVGGLVGEHSGTMSNCYSTGSVTGGNFVGGLTGKNEKALIENCFWDVNSSGEPNSAGGTGKTTVEMQTRSTFTDAGWDFVNIWDICEGTNYPKFVWQIPAADFVCPDGVNFIDYAFFAEHWLQSIYGDCGEVELTGDGKVNWVDFALFAEYWRLTGCGECGGADFTGDENVDLADLYVFATYWLETEYADVDLTNDGQVDLDDLREFTENWLAGL